jgi:hypothetical protein
MVATASFGVLKLHTASLVTSRWSPPKLPVTASDWVVPTPMLMPELPTGL